MFNFSFVYCFENISLILTKIKFLVDLGEIARAKFDFDVVGHYSRPEVLSLTVRDHPTNPVTFTSSSPKTEGLQKS